MWKWRKVEPVPEDRIVLGLQQAAAFRANLKHEATHPGLESPLAGVSFTNDPVSRSLLHYVPSSVDLLVEEVVKRFRESDPGARSAMRDSLTPDDFGTIGFYAWRRAAQVLLSRQPEEAAPALDALAMITKARIDNRTIIWRLRNLRLAISKVSDDETADRLFDSSARMAESETAHDFRSFAGLSFDELSRYSRLSIVEYEHRLVILEHGTGRYEPTVNLLKLADQIGTMLQSDGYGHSGLVVGGLLGYRWLEESVGAQMIHENSVASVGSGLLMREDFGNDDLPIFLFNVFEVATVEEREAFEASWAAGNRSFASMAVGLDRVVALFIASTVLPGAKPLETNLSLKRFAKQTAEILENMTR